MLREVCTEALLGEYLLEADFCFLEKNIVQSTGALKLFSWRTTKCSLTHAVYHQ
jgi:hypothetical protein